jgi:hypothetical protein
MSPPVSKTNRGPAAVLAGDGSVKVATLRRVLFLTVGANIGSTRVKHQLLLLHTAHGLILMLGISNHP